MYYSYKKIIFAVFDNASYNCLPTLSYKFDSARLKSITHRA